MNQPPNRDPHEVAMQQARLEQQMMESKLEIARSYRQRRESASSRRFMFVFVLGAAMGIAYVLDKKGFSPQVTIGVSFASIAVFGAWWAFRKPYGP